MANSRDTASRNTRAMGRKDTSIASMRSGLARSIAGVFRRWLGRRPPTAEHLALGARGERLAARHLRGNGYRVLYRNFRSRRGGEIDLVCRDVAANALVFVEVKTRRSEDFGRPAAAVDRKKRARIIRGAMEWLRLLDMPDITFRFDIVEVIMRETTEIRVIPNAFNLEHPYLY